jgi:hypothetical protein
MTTQVATKVAGIPAITIKSGNVAMTGMQSMANKMWAPWVVMGLMIVVISFIVGIVLAGIEASYFENSKEAREAAARGSSIALEQARIQSIMAWLPGFKFLGLGFLLGGITFLLATILGNLRVAGGKVQKALGAEQIVIKKPLTGTLFPMLMMMGMMILVVTLGVSIWLAGETFTYWNNSVATVLNPATAGSETLRDLGVIKATGAWLTPLKFVGMAVLFSGIALALVTIVSVLRFQAARLTELALSKEA